jgi:hypothetical protein
VVAIESLLDEGSPPHQCDRCGMPHYPSITGAFRDFLATYVPDRTERGELYAARSKIAHGAKVFEWDVPDELGGGFFPMANHEQQQHDQVTTTCRVALVNWLASRAA